MLALSRDQVRRIDRLAIEKYGIPGVVLMENAGRSAADVVLQLIRNDLRLPATTRVGIFCGGGNNGGDGYVIARHLHHANAIVTVFAATPLEKLSGDAAINATIVQRMNLPVRPVANSAELAAAAPEFAQQRVLVDALLGTGFHGEVSAELAAVIERCNALAHGGAKVVAIDVPSGLDCDTGAPSNAVIRADVTVTFVAMKRGFLSPVAQAFTGLIKVAGIGAPQEIVDDVVRGP